MELHMSERRWRSLLGLGLFGVVLAAYIETMAGSTSFWDCGEFIAAAYTLGIPHPPATPLYVVLGRVFTLLPFPFSVAQRVNFMSALFGALGVVVLFQIVVELIRGRRGEPRSAGDRVVVYGSALVAALCTAWSNTYWTNSIEAEVYALSSFVMGLTIWLALLWARRPEAPESTRYVHLIVYLLALGLGFHLGTVLTYPAIALFLLLFPRSSLRRSDVLVLSFGFFLFLAFVNLRLGGFPALLALLVFLALLARGAARRSAGGGREARLFVAGASGLVLLGVSIHLFLLIRSGQNPALDEADPETWRNFLAVLRREQYPVGNPLVRNASWSFQILGQFGRYFREQYEMLGPGAPAGWRQGLAYVPILLGLAGMVSLAKSDRRRFLLLFVTFLVCSLGLIVYLNFNAHEDRARDYFYSPAFYFYGVFVGLGIAAALDRLLAPQPGGAARRRARIGYPAGVALFLALSCLVHWRHHFEHDRTHERLPWACGYNMLAGLEPNALVFTNGDNDTYPLWYQQEVEGFRRDVRVINLSMLNAGWYIRQLKESEPRVEIDWSDAQIAGLRGEILGGKVILPRDRAMWRIVEDNFAKRPIYVAVTVPPETWADYADHLVLEGLVRRLTNRQGQDREDIARMERNATQVYRYDGLLTPDGKNDTSVYRDTNQLAMAHDYATVFRRLAAHAARQAEAAGDEATRQQHYERAAAFYERAIEISPDVGAIRAELDELRGKMGRGVDPAPVLRGGS
jgi:hypothetical protein